MWNKAGYPLNISTAVSLGCQAVARCALTSAVFLFRKVHSVIANGLWAMRSSCPNAFRWQADACELSPPDG